MIGLSIAKLWRTVCSQKDDFPDPGEPTRSIMLSDGTSFSWVNETNNIRHSKQSLISDLFNLPKKFQHPKIR